MPQTSLSANGSLMLSVPQTLRPGRKRFKRGDAGRRQEEAPQQESAWRLAGACEWLDTQCDAEGPFFMGPKVRLCSDSFACAAECMRGTGSGFSDQRWRRGFGGCSRSL